MAEPCFQPKEAEAGAGTCRTWSFLSSTPSLTEQPVPVREGVLALPEVERHIHKGRLLDYLKRGWEGRRLQAQPRTTQGITLPICSE